MRKQLLDYTEIMEEWDWRKNVCNPALLGSKSSKMPWWKCRNGHSWQSKVYNRTRGQGCPYCSGKRVHVDNCLATLRPDLAAQWHPTKNEDLTPYDVTPGSGKKAWWICEKGHEWVAIVYNRKRAGCPYCVNQKILPESSLAATHPILASEWDGQNRLTAWEVSSGSGQLAWWVCKEGHRWEAKIYSRATGIGCPYCANRKIDGANNLSMQFPHLVEEWSPKNGALVPEDMAPHSGRKVWWRCGKGHEWMAAISSRASGSGCPYCANRVIDAGNSLKALRPDLAAEWHVEKNWPLTADSVAPGSDMRVFWRCEQGHVWKTAVYHRTADHGCPYCAGGSGTSFPEQAIYYYLGQCFAAQNRAMVNGQEVDVYLPELKIGVEYDGSYFHTDKTRWRERQKDRLLREAGVRVIRVKEAQKTDVDWERRHVYCIPRADYRYIEIVVKSLLAMIGELCPHKSVMDFKIDIRGDYDTIKTLYYEARQTE